MQPFSVEEHPGAAVKAWEEMLLDGVANKSVVETFFYYYFVMIEQSIGHVQVM